MTISTNTKSILEDLLLLRRNIVEDVKIAERFEQAPNEFLDILRHDLNICVGENTTFDIYDTIIESPKGLRSVNLDFCIGILCPALSDLDTEDPVPEPRGPVPLPFIGFNVIAAYNALVLGNAVAYHEAFAGLFAAVGAVTVKTIKYTGAIDVPMPET